MSVLAAAATPLVDWAALWKIALVALCGGIGVTAIFGFGVLRLQAFDDERDRGGSGGVNLAIAGVCAAICIAAVVVGVFAMMHKS